MSAAADLPIPAELAYDEPPLTDVDLDAYFARFGEEPDPDYAPAPPSESPVGRWIIEDDGAAEWCLRHVALIDQETSALRVQADDWEERIGAWFEKSVRPLDQRRRFFVAHLERYAATVRDETGRKSLVLPSGKVTSRASNPAAVVADEAAVLAWAHHNLTGDDLASVVKVVESVQVSELRKVVTVKDDLVVSGDGEVVPGVEVRPGSVTFSVSTT